MLTMQRLLTRHLKMDKPALISLPFVKEQRGTLTSIEASSDIPIEILRVFYMHHIYQERGGHAHLDTDQIVIAVAGSFDIQLLSTNGDKNQFHLADPNVGLYIPRMHFLNIKNISTNTVCLVLANTHYDMEKSIRTLSDFQKYMVA